MYSKTNLIIRSSVKIVSIISFLSFFAGISIAAPGDVDYLFGINGFSTLDRKTSLDESFTSFALSDGSTIQVGKSDSSGKISLLKLGPDGSKDTSFGTEGIVVLYSYNKWTSYISNEYDAFGSFVKVISEQMTDGRIVIATSFRQEIYLFRIMPDGALDPTFGAKGITKLVFPPSVVGNMQLNSVNDINIDAEGRITLVGHLHFEKDIFLMRLQSGGNLDTSFWINGVKLLEGSFEPDPSLTVLNDGTVLVACGTGGLGRIFALDSIGNYLPSNRFNMFSHYFEAPNAVLKTRFVSIRRRGNKVIAVADYNRGVGIAQFFDNGDWDNSFGSNSKVRIPASSDVSVSSFVTARNGRILVTGGIGGRPFIHAVSATGNLDTTFNGTGSVYVPETDFKHGNHIRVLPNGKIFLTAKQTSNNLGFEKKFATLRYNSDGSRDTTFNTTVRPNVNWRKYNIAANDWGIISHATQSDGRIVALVAHPSNQKMQKVARFLEDGSIDSTFGIDGFANYPALCEFTYDFLSEDRFVSIVVQPDDKILLGGKGLPSCGLPGSAFSATRLNPDGTTDSSFGYYGLTRVILAGDQEARAMALREDGTILIAGSSTNENGTSFHITGLTANGAVNTSFGTRGHTTINVGAMTSSGYYPSEAQAIGIQSAADGGKIVLGGWVKRPFTRRDFAVVLLNSNGLPDNNFGSQGKRIDDFSLLDDEIRAISIKGSTITTAGTATSSESGKDFALMRMTTTGSITRFGISGKVVLAIGTNDDILNAMAVQADGKIIVAGAGIPDGSSYEHVSVVRFSGNGVLDQTFGTGGTVSHSYYGLGDYPNAISILNSGKLLVSGFTFNGANTQAAMTRLNLQ